MPEATISPWFWIVFATIVIFVLALDLGVFHRKAHQVKTKEALAWVCVWTALALAFNAGVYLWMGHQKGLEFLTGYLIEQALSVDNLFVFILVFSFFKVPSIFQHRVLFWGILGALVMRGIFIFAGTALVHRFEFMLVLFGGFLVFTGLKILLQKEDDKFDPEHNVAVRIFRRWVPLLPDFHGAKFFVYKDGKRWATPLFLVLAIVEASDVIFAIDSIPAILAVTTDSFIVYTSNIFAILGLRSLYFLLSGIMDKFRYLKVGLGIILCFVGVKMVLGYWGLKVPIEISLGVIVLLLFGSVLASILIPAPQGVVPIEPEAPNLGSRPDSAGGKAATLQKNNPGAQRD